MINRSNLLIRLFKYFAFLLTFIRSIISKIGILKFPNFLDLSIYNFVIFYIE